MRNVRMLQALCVALAGVTIFFIVLDLGTWIFIAAALCCTMAALVAHERHGTP